MKAALQALELLRNANDTQQEVSDDYEDNQNFDNDLKNEMKYQINLIPNINQMNYQVMNNLKKIKKLSLAKIPKIK